MGGFGTLWTKGGSMGKKKGNKFPKATVDTTAPTITSANPSGSYLEGLPIGGKLQASEIVTWSVLGTDASTVTLNAVTGDWSLAATVFSQKSSYSLTFRATDTAGNYADQAVTLTITQLVIVDTTPPTITSANPSGSYVEGVTISGILNADEESTWSVTGVDASAVTLNASTGAWSLETTVFATKDAYAWTFTATDASDNATDQGVSIAITEAVSEETDTAYDTSIGDGVDQDGFANLPLSPGGTTGDDVLSIPPTSAGLNIGYTSATRTLAGTTTTNTGTLATWAGVLTPGQEYRLQLGLAYSGSVAFHIKDESGNIVWTRGSAASGNHRAIIDETFTATGHNLVLYYDNAKFSGSIQIGMVAPHSGAIGAIRLFVSSETGSDAGGPLDALNPVTPAATLAAAVKLVKSGRGDQILLAEGETFPEAIPVLTAYSGASSVYPTVIQSYGPSDALNEAKYGRASAGNKPRIGVFNASLGSPDYVVIRGLDCNFGNNPLQSMGFVATTTKAISYILWENNILRFVQVGCDNNPAWTTSGIKGSHHIYRMNAIYGAYSTSGAKVQGIYDAGTIGVTIEDNVFWHNGWKTTATRGDTTANGGFATGGLFDHSAYIQYTTENITYRRNAVIQGPADGGHLLSDCVVQENLIIHCPRGIDVAPSTSYNAGGNLQDVGYNAILECNDISGSGTGSDARGQGIWTGNGAPGSAIHHNLVARTLHPGSTNRGAFGTENVFGSSFTSYASWHDNVAYLATATPKSTISEYDNSGANPIVTSYENNAWDDPASGTNINIADYVAPNPYTADELYAAGGYADEDAFVAYAIENPDLKPGRALYNLLMAGYGIDHAI